MKVKRTILILISTLISISVAISIIRFFSVPSENTLRKQINLVEYKNSFRALVIDTYIDTTNKHLIKFRLKTVDTLQVFWPRFLSQRSREIKVGDSLIKVSNSYKYIIKRPDTVFYIETRPLR